MSNKTKRVKEEVIEKAKSVSSLPRAEYYQYSVSWSPEDEAYVARVAEFPSLAAHGDSLEEALREIKFVVNSAIKDLARENEPLPEPLSKHKYSGKFQVRVSRYLHRRLALEAAEQGISLNQLVTQKLSIPIDVPLEVLATAKKQTEKNR